MKKALVALCAAVVGASLMGCSDQAGLLGPGSALVSDQAVKSVYPALVRINVVMTSPAEGRMQKQQASGSGAIISPEGYVITNHHVAGRAERIVCRLADRQEIEATLVATDPMTDIAMLKLKLDQRKDPKAPLPVAKFGDSDHLRVGDIVLAMGSPAGLSQSVTSGIVSNTEMILPYGSLNQEGEAVGTLVRWIGHSATIYHGNSGGPLVNLQGEIIGINEIGIGGIGGAIPASIAKSVAAQLIAPPHAVSRSWTGLECQCVLKSYRGQPGVLVSGVINDSPAAKAGLQSGDIITEFDGQAVQASVAEELPLFNKVVLSCPVGKKVKISALRNGKAMPFELTTLGREHALGLDREIKGWGMTAMELTAPLMMEMQRANKDGVIVESVRPTGQAGTAKPALAAGDIIVEVGGKKVNSIEDLQKVTDALTSSGTAGAETLVGFDRGVRKFLTVVKIGKEVDQKDPPRAKKPWLGAATQVLTRDLARVLKLDGKTGVRITQVLPKGPADKGGMKVGDVVLAIDGEQVRAQQIEDEEVFPNMIRKQEIDKEVSLDIVRDGTPKKITVKLELPPTPASDLKMYKDDDFEFTARELSASDRTDKKLSDKVQGVLIERVESAGWASLGGLGMGDVLISIDGQNVTSIQKVEELLSAAKKNKEKRLVFFIKRGIHTMYLEMTSEWK